MADLVLRNVSRSFGTVSALRDINFTVGEGEFVSLLGPSGCGKSTTLAIVAGLDRPTTGQVIVGGQVMADGDAGAFVPAEDRRLGLVLQSYALWPHMTVRQNISLPLEIRKMPKAKRNDRIDEYLELVELSEYGDRFPHELSGGQQQRVALARTLVYEPVILLLDEPLSNVDAKLRERARTWLRQLQRRFGITTIFVTHDQSEALTMSDRIAVMSMGEMIQLGTPEEVYARPATPFVADFVGSSNFVQGVMEGRGSDGLATVQVGPVRLAVPVTHELAVGDKVTVAIRPEKIYQVSGEGGGNVLDAQILHRDFLGSRSLYHVDIGGQSIRFETSDPALTGQVRIGFAPSDSFVFAR